MSERSPPRLYVEGALKAGRTVSLTAPQEHYLSHVLRRGPGDGVHLFNGADGLWLARLGEGPRRTLVLVAEACIQPQRDPPDLWLLFAPIKRQRIDLVAEKAAELGARALRPVITRRTIVERVNLERLRAHAIEAAEQCGLLRVPEIWPPLSLERLIDGWPADRRLLYCDESGEAPAILDALQGAPRGGPWAILTGPEGGFDDAERRLLRQSPAVMAVSLGPRVMRADTAIVAAMAVWQTVQGDWR